MVKRNKACNRILDQGYLTGRKEGLIAAGYEDTPKWITFCETLLTDGYTLSLYEAKKTYSKYITVIRGQKQFKVRFSNHKPILYRELRGDCDFFVGVTNLKTTNTAMALAAVRSFFQGQTDDEGWE